MKTTITVSVDGEVKEEAMKIIQNKMNSSLSKVINDRLKEICELENGQSRK